MLTGAFGGFLLTASFFTATTAYCKPILSFSQVKPRLHILPTRKVKYYPQGLFSLGNAVLDVVLRY